MKPRLRAYLLLLIVAFIWGLAGPVIKLTLKALPPDIFILYRFFISSIIAIIIFALQGIKIPKDNITRLEFITYCFFNSTISLGLLFWGTSKTSLLDMSLISLFGPLLLILAGYIFLKEHVTKKEKLGIIIAFLGSAIISISPILNMGHDGSLFGNLLIFLSLLSGAFCGILAKKLMRKNVSPNLLANASFVIGFISIFIYLLTKQNLTSITSTIISIPLIYQAGIFYMAILSGNVAYVFYNMAQKSIELSESAPFSYLYPLFSALLAIFLLGDKLTIPIIMGVIITLVGVVIAESKHRLL